MKKEQLHCPSLRWLDKAIHCAALRCEAWCFPELCIICDKVRASGDAWLCKHCHEALIENSCTRSGCPRCGLNPQIRQCSCEIAWDFPFEKIHSIFDYNELVQELVRNIKYHGKKTLASKLASYIADCKELKGCYDAVTAVPLHWTRYQKRGYNQAQWFAKGVSSGTDIPLLSSVLKRRKSTGTQTKLDRLDRQNNLKNAFSIDHKKLFLIENKRILLADDVITTGATVRSCTEALLNAGCKSVGVISIARD